VNDP